jgi:hypothetical protein
VHDIITGYARDYAKKATDAVEALLLSRGIVRKRDPELARRIELELISHFHRARGAHDPDT